MDARQVSIIVSMCILFVLLLEVFFAILKKKVLLNTLQDQMS